MHRHLLPAIAAVVALGCAGPGTETPKAGTAQTALETQREVQLAEREWAAAVVAQNLDKLDELYHPELLYAHSSGIVESKSEYLGKLRGGIARYDTVEFEELEVRPHGETAIAHSRVRMQGVNADGPFHFRLMMIHVWVREAGAWRMAAHQTTRLEVLPPAQ